MTSFLLLSCFLSWTNTGPPAYVYTNCTNSLEVSTTERNWRIHFSGFIYLIRAPVTLSNCTFNGSVKDELNATSVVHGARLSAFILNFAKADSQTSIFNGTMSGNLSSTNKTAEFGAGVICNNF